MIAAIAAFAAGGCRQLFGIDDTQAETDAGAGDDSPDAVRVDGRAQTGSPCDQDHALCVDFDSQATGVALLPDVTTIGVATAEEIEASDAPSPPRILRALADPSSMTGGALVGKTYLGGTLKSGTISFALRVPTPTMGQVCDPLVFALAWVMDMTPAMQIDVVIKESSFVLDIQSPAVTVENTIPFERDRWIDVDLTFDYVTSTVSAVAGSDSTSTPAPNLSAVANDDAAVGIGVVATNDHGACTAELDNFVIDFAP
jgi:hypothetical protein